MKSILPAYNKSATDAIIRSSASSLVKYPAKAHARNVAKSLRAYSDDGLIFLKGQEARLLEDSDMPVPFRQRRYFYYLTGFDEPDACVTYDMKTDELVLYIRPLNPREVLWSGFPPSIPECLARYNVDRVETTDALEITILKYTRANPNGIVYTIHDHLPPKGAYRIDNHLLQPIMNFHRVYKDDFEISLIRKAVQISLSAHAAVKDLATNASNEAELQACFERVCTANHAKVQAYEPICASGRNCATLHYVRNDQPLKGKQLALIDSSCEWKCYASDVTRTFSLDGNWTPEAKAIYDIVQEMQTRCIRETIPGMAWGRTHYLAHRIATEGLLKLGILKGASADFLFQIGTSKAFFPHGLGHFIGLDVHDVEEPIVRAEDLTLGYDFSPKLTAVDDSGDVVDCNIPLDGVGHWSKVHIAYPRVLRPSMVLTVEPGIYFCEWIIKDYLNHPIHSKYIDASVLEKYWDVGGVRLEDAILVTENGNENLTNGEKICAKVLGWERRAGPIGNNPTYSGKCALGRTGFL